MNKQFPSSVSGNVSGYVVVNFFKQQMIVGIIVFVYCFWILGKLLALLGLWSLNMYSHGMSSRVENPGPSKIKVVLYDVLSLHSIFKGFM